MRNQSSRRGGTLTELMVATVILSIGVLGLFGAFKFIARTTLISRATSLATNLGQERIESLKNLSYYALQITTATGNLTIGATDYLYDTVNYPAETIQIGGVIFTRYTYVGMAEMSGSDIVDVAFTYPDTGLKQITVHTVWSEAGRQKVWTLRNLLENPSISPLDATITGTVSNSAGGTVASAIVVTEQNENWGATANSAGVYSFSVYHGSYTLRASSTGFTDGITGSLVAHRGGTTTGNMTLSAVATGYIQGTTWVNYDLVISQVVAATRTIVGNLTEQEVEYIELFNPTTGPINIGVTNNASPKPYSILIGNIILGANVYHWDNSPEPANAYPFYMKNVSTYVAPGRYYLVANASYFYMADGWVTADAYYTDSWANYNQNPVVEGYPDYLPKDEPSSILLYSGNSGTWHDEIGWRDGSGTTPPYCENTCLTNGAGDGLGEGNQIVRVSSPGISAAALPNYGRAYDSNINTRDFYYSDGTYYIPVAYPPKSLASGAFTTITGKTTTGAFISASDPNSQSVLTTNVDVSSGALLLPTSRFVLGGVSTGTWTVSMSYGGYAAFVETVTVTQNGYAVVPNATTTPAWAGVNLQHTQLSSTTAAGFVKGTIKNTNGAALSGITVEGGGASKVTGSNGVYFMPVSSGTLTIIANPNNLNPSYVQGIDAVTVTAGAVSIKDFTLTQGGRITGYVTTGTTPLAFQAVTVVNAAGLQVGAGVTDTGGNFTIRNVSTTSFAAAYTVSPVLESGSDANPNTLPAPTAAGWPAGGDVFVGTFTVNGAFGSIVGTITDASGLVTSGALILASTNTILATPAAIVASSSPAQVPLYMISSKADGTYILPVRGGAATYYLSAYVPVISGVGTVTITTKTYSGIAVSASVATTRDVTIP